MKSAEAREWLLEASRYFAKRDTGGEDNAFWANQINSDNCRFIAQLIGELEQEITILIEESKAERQANGQFGVGA